MEANDRVRVTIGICTYDRAALLQRCLESLDHVRIPTRWDVDVLVANNGDPWADRETCASLATRVVHEPQPGVSSARNRVLDEADRAGATWVVMIDDDEMADPDWLLAYAEAMRRYPKTAFFCGPYAYPVPPGFSRWRRPPWLDDRPLGTQADFAKGGNMILHRSIFGRDAGNVRFDPLFDQSGGEDYDISRRLIAAGHTPIFVPEAKVSEPVTPARAGIVYGLLRAWRDRAVRQKYRYARHSLGAGLRADLCDIAALIADIAVAIKDTMLALCAEISRRNGRT